MIEGFDKTFDIVLQCSLGNALTFVEVVGDIVDVELHHFLFKDINLIKLTHQ